MAITYKTVINNAIKGFNDIQAKLAEYTDLGVSAVSVSNGTVSGALTPANLITNIGKMATIKKSDGSFISGKVSIVTPKFDGGGASIASSSTSASASGLTMSDTDTDPGSGIYITTSGSATASRAAVLYNGAVNGYVSIADNTSALAAANGSATNLSTNRYYVTALTVPSTKTLSSVTLTAGTGDTTRTSLGTLTTGSYTKIDKFTNSGKVMELDNPGIIVDMHGSNNRITTLHGTTAISNHGTETEAGTMTITANTYGTVNVWNAGGDKGVQVANHTVKVDGTTVTNSSGDLTTTSRSASTGYVTLTAGAGSASVSGSNVTLSDTNNGISVTATGSGTVSGTGYGKVSTGTGWISSGTTQSNTSASSSATSNEATATKYISAITVPASKTLSSVTLTSGTSSSRTYLTTATVNSYTTISTLNLSGVITSLVHNSDGYVSTQNLGTAGSIKTLQSSSGGYIGTVSGTLAINNVGTSSTASTLTVGTNTYGTVNVWNAGGDKGVQVKNHTVKVDGVTVTNSSGDLITDTPAFDGGGLTVPNPSVSLAVGETDGTGNITSVITDNGTTEPTSGYYVAIKGTASAITASRADVLYNGAVSGWTSVSDNAVALSSTTESNSAVSSTEYFKIPSGSHNVTVTNSVTAPKVTVSGSATGFTASSSATSYYVTVSGSGTNGSVTSNASCTATAGYIAAGTDTASDTDAISTTITGSGNKVYIPAAASTMYASSSANTTTNCIKGTTYLRTAGYAPTGAKTVYVTSPSVVGTVSLTVGSGARLNTANNGTIAIVSNEGTLIVDEWQMSVEYTEDNDNSQTTSVIFTLGD